MSDERARARVRLAGGRLAYGVLTTEHPASSYGRPVIVLDDGDVVDAWMAAEIEIAPDAPDQGASGQDGKARACVRANDAGALEENRQDYRRKPAGEP